VFFPLVFILISLVYRVETVLLDVNEEVARAEVGTWMAVEKSVDAIIGKAEFVSYSILTCDDALLKVLVVFPDARDHLR
jgi:hypothetical protein